MTNAPIYLVTGAGGGVAGISPQVVARLLGRGETVRAMVHHDDSRADALRGLGAEVIAGDLTNPVDVFAAMSGVSRMFFNMSVSPDYLQATTVVCVAAKELGNLEVLVNMSQMTVSQMTATSTEESQPATPALARRARHQLVGRPCRARPADCPAGKPALRHVGRPLDPRSRPTVAAVRNRSHLARRVQ